MPDSYDAYQLHSDRTLRYTTHLEGCVIIGLLIWFLYDKMMLLLPILESAVLMLGDGILKELCLEMPLRSQPFYLQLCHCT